MPWDLEPGVLELPSGRRLRARGLRRPLSRGPLPEAAGYLLGRPPAAVPWEARWVRWPDFRLPSDRDDARAALVWAGERADDVRGQVACGGGRGRTGTALAAWPWQRRYVERFA